MGKAVKGPLHGKSLYACRQHIISVLTPAVVHLSQHKFASNVMEKCLQYGEPADREVSSQWPLPARAACSCLHSLHLPVQRQPPAAFQPTSPLDCLLRQAWVQHVPVAPQCAAHAACAEALHSGAPRVIGEMLLLYL